MDPIASIHHLESATNSGAASRTCRPVRSHHHRNLVPANRRRVDVETRLWILRRSHRDRLEHFAELAAGECRVALQRKNLRIDSRLARSLVKAHEIELRLDEPEASTTSEVENAGRILDRVFGAIEGEFRSIRVLAIWGGPSDASPLRIEVVHKGSAIFGRPRGNRAVRRYPVEANVSQPLTGG